LDVRYCADIQIDCPQLECLISEKNYPHRKCTTYTAQRFIINGASDPNAFIPINQTGAGPDVYQVNNK